MIKILDGLRLNCEDLKRYTNYTVPQAATMIKGRVESLEFEEMIFCDGKVELVETEESFEKYITPKINAVANALKEVDANLELIKEQAKTDKELALIDTFLNSKFNNVLIESQQLQKVFNKKIEVSTIFDEIAKSRKSNKKVKSITKDELRLYLKNHFREFYTKFSKYLINVDINTDSIDAAVATAKNTYDSLYRHYVELKDMLPARIYYNIDEIINITPEMELFIADHYRKQAFCASDPDIKLIYLSVLKDFIMEHYVENYKRMWELRPIDKKHFVIKFESIVRKYEELSGETISKNSVIENKIFILEHFKLFAGEAKDTIHRISTDIKRKRNNPDIDQMINDKVDFLNQLDFNEIHVGTNSFDGYIYIRLNDGWILLDQLDYGSAMFIVKEADLVKVFNSTRTDIALAIKNKEIPGYYIPHGELWQDKANQYIKELAM